MSNLLQLSNSKFAFSRTEIIGGRSVPIMVNSTCPGCCCVTSDCTDENSLMQMGFVHAKVTMKRTIDPYPSASYCKDGNAPTEFHSYDYYGDWTGQNYKEYGSVPDYLLLSSATRSLCGVTCTKNSEKLDVTGAVYEFYEPCDFYIGNCLARCISRTSSTIMTMTVTVENMWSNTKVTVWYDEDSYEFQSSGTKVFTTSYPKPSGYSQFCDPFTNIMVQYK